MSHHTLHVPVTFGQAVTAGYNPTQSLHACMQQASVLVASAGLNLKGGDTCLSIHDQPVHVHFFGRGGGWEKSVKYRAVRLLCLSMKMKEN